MSKAKGLSCTFQLWTIASEKQCLLVHQFRTKMALQNVFQIKHPTVAFSLFAISINIVKQSIYLVLKVTIRIFEYKNIH